MDRRSCSTSSLVRRVIEHMFVSREGNVKSVPMPEGGARYRGFARLPLALSY
jgi:hypothetical protein